MLPYKNSIIEKRVQNNHINISPLLSEVLVSSYFLYKFSNLLDFNMTNIVLLDTKYFLVFNREKM